MVLSSWKIRLIIVVSGLVLISLGFIVGLLAFKGINIDGGLSYDGITSLIVGLVAVFAATVVLPIMIQPYFRKQRSLSDITHENIKLIVSSLDEVLNLLSELNTSGNQVSIPDRKSLLALYSRIANYCAIISRHSSEIPALSGFKDSVEAPLTKSKTNFAEVVLPGGLIEDVLYLSIKDTLEPVIYELMEVRYKIS
jgi:hypothetical protein